MSKLTDPGDIVSPRTVARSDDHGRDQRRLALAKVLQGRLMSNVASNSSDHDDAVFANPAAVYIDQHYCAEEKRRLFQSLPVVAALSTDIPCPGDRVLFDDAGLPILIARGANGEVRAFLNICRHRAARLVSTCSAGPRMTCPFHGWTYDLEGRLLGKSAGDAFDGVLAGDFSLEPVPVAEWNGLIFVIARAGQESIDVAAYLRDFAPEVADINFKGTEFVKRTRLDANANWKYCLDTFGEGYHVSTLHPNTVGKFILCDSVIYDQAGPHHRMSFANRQMVEDSRKPRELWPEAQLRVIYLLFPNTLIQSTPLAGGYNHIIYRIFPGDTPGKSFTLLETYRSCGPGANPDPQPWIDAHDFQVRVVGGEDYPMAESAQRSLERAPPGWRVFFGRNEMALQRFHRQVANLIGRGLDVDIRDGAKGVTD